MELKSRNVQHAQNLFDHAVTLLLCRSTMVQMCLTTKCYITTQGPLPATFTDFWTSVSSTLIQVEVTLIVTTYLQTLLEQNVHVIVMLTHALNPT